MNKPLIVGGALIEPGDVREVHIPISEAANSRAVLLPVTIVRGREEGPIIFMTGAVHGDELNGTAILGEIITRITPPRLTGTLILVPVVNVLGFLARSRYLPDRRDLNRFFPGRRDGNMAQRIAFRLFEDIVRRCDMGIDLHTAPDGRENFPHIRGDMSVPGVRKMAKAFGASIIVDDKGRAGMLRWAATKVGIPTIVFEGGTADKFERPIVRAGVNGIEGLLVRMGMLKKKKKRRRLPFQIIIRNTQWIRSERGGILELKTYPGGLLYRGDPVAAVSNPLGREVHVIPSPTTGLVIGVITSPVTNPGTPIAHVVELKKTLPTVERAISSGAFKVLK